MFMRRELAMNRLRDMDTGFGVHVYRKPDLALVLGETGQRLDRTLSSLVAANVLVRAARGVYAFAWSAHLGEATLHTVARRLRPRQLVWESLESALSRWGVISQIPVDRVTDEMTTSSLFPAMSPDTVNVSILCFLSSVIISPASSLRER